MITEGGERSAVLCYCARTRNGLSEIGRLATTEAYGSVNRSLVIGDTVYMLSDHALQANSLDTHRETGKLIL